MTEDHKFINLSSQPRIGMISEASILVISHYLKEFNRSKEKWRKEKKSWNINWALPNGEAKISKEINYLIIAGYIRRTALFNPADFNLPYMSCFWMDNSLDMKLNFHLTDHTGTFGLQSGSPQVQYGPDYPIKPKLQREGFLYTTFQPQLLNRIINQRLKIIENSNIAYGDEWVFDLRTLISDSISLLDITLTQLYIKAEYDPLPGWVFDKDKLGERHGRRINDKLKWVFQITGKNLYIESEKPSLNVLKDLRNHLMHFDPPSLVITYEEATIWLNQILDLGIILIKIRKAINAEITQELINLILQKEAVFTPFDKNIKRKPIGESLDEDYFSTTWQDNE